MRGSDDRNARFDRRINCIEVSPAIRSEFSLGAEFKIFAPPHQPAFDQPHPD